MRNTERLVKLYFGIEFTGHTFTISATKMLYFSIFQQLIAGITRNVSIF